MTDAGKTPGQIAYETYWDSAVNDGLQDVVRYGWNKWWLGYQKRWHKTAEAVRAPLIATIQEQAERIAELEGIQNQADSMIAEFNHQNVNLSKRIAELEAELDSLCICLQHNNVLKIDRDCPIHSKLLTATK